MTKFAISTPEQEKETTIMYLVPNFSGGVQLLAQKRGTDNCVVLASISEKGIQLGGWVQGLGIAVDDSGVNKMKVIT